MSISDIYVIPDKQGQIVYAPRLGIMFEAEEQFCDRLRTFIDTGVAEDEFLGELKDIGLTALIPDSSVAVATRVNHALAPTSMIFLFSESCNLKCRYCFASAGEQRSEPFDEEMAREAVRFVIDNAIVRKEECVISFHGGGEPTYDYEWLREIVGFGCRYAREKGLSENLHFMIVTNGFMSDAKARWLGENMSRVQVSLDGYPEIQNEQRPTRNGKTTFDRVFRTIKTLENSDTELVVRTTVSRRGQDTLPEIAKFLCENISVDRFYFGAVNNYGRAAVSEYCEPEADPFIAGLLEAQKVASEYGKRIIACSSQDNFPNITYEYCGATVPIFGLTKHGNVTSCPEVLDEEDSRRRIFWYGRYDTEARQFVFDTEKITQLVSYRAKDTSKCSSCFAKYQCAGDCRARWYDYSTGEQMAGSDFRCVVNRGLVQRRIREHCDR